MIGIPAYIAGFFAAQNPPPEDFALLRMTLVPGQWAPRARNVMYLKTKEVTEASRKKRVFGGKEMEEEFIWTPGETLLDSGGLEGDAK